MDLVKKLDEEIISAMKEKNTINNFIIQTPRYIPSGTFGFH